MERFWSKVNKTDTCWLWTGAISGTGYGNFYVGTINGKKRYQGAHKIAWEAANGRIAKGLVLDHLCRVRSCVRPSHMRVATHRVNILAGTGWGAQHVAVTECPRGHPYDKANTLRRDGRRRCRVCANEQRKKHPSYK